jgi:hypothetical protein
VRRGLCCFVLFVLFFCVWFSLFRFCFVRVGMW